MNSKKSFTGFYCQKCNSIPLIEIIPKNNTISIFFFCKCHKRCLPIDLFNKNYYKKDIKLGQISSTENNKDQNNFKTKLQNEKYINDIIQDYYKTKKELNEYSKNIKEDYIDSLMLKIQQINKAYEKYLLINEKIQNIFEILIESYIIFDDNINNLKNLINNSNFNKKPLHMGFNFSSLINFYGEEFIIKTPEQMKTIKSFYNHLKGVNCFLDYKYGNEYYGVSSSYDSNIAIYELIENKHLFSFNGDREQVNWITISSEKNIISCGNDCTIKIWPLINSTILKTLNNILINGKQIVLHPLHSYKCEDIIVKIEYIINKNKSEKHDYLLGCSLKSIDLFIYKQFQDDIINDNQLNLIARYKNERIYNILFLKNINNIINNYLVCAFSNAKIFVLNYPELEKIKEKNNLKISLISKNNCIQLNGYEILFIEFRLLTIFNIIKFQKTFSIKMEGVVDSLTKLKDGTIVQGGQKGIKRYLQNNFLELPLLNKGYDDDDEDDYAEYIDIYDTEIESILCIKELLDGRIVFCYQHKAVNISKLNIF